MSNAFGRYNGDEKFTAQRNVPGPSPTFSAITVMTNVSSGVTVSGGLAVYFHAGGGAVAFEVSSSHSHESASRSNRSDGAVAS